MSSWRSGIPLLALWLAVAGAAPAQVPIEIPGRVETLPAPIEGFSLADLVDLTRELSARGATIAQLNGFRRELSRVQGGGLARACGAGRLYAVILSDVLGDDLTMIASGPTVLREPTPQAAIETLEDLGLGERPAARRAIRLLEGAASGTAASVRTCR